MNRHGDMEPMIYDYPGEPDRPEPIEPEMHRYGVSLYTHGCINLVVEAKDDYEAAKKARHLWFNEDVTVLAEDMELYSISDIILNQLDIGTRTYRSKEVD